MNNCRVSGLPLLAGHNSYSPVHTPAARTHPHRSKQSCHTATSDSPQGLSFRYCESPHSTVTASVSCELGCNTPTVANKDRECIAWCLQATSPIFCRAQIAMLSRVARAAQASSQGASGRVGWWVNFRTHSPAPLCMMPQHAQVHTCTLHCGR